MIGPGHYAVLGAVLLAVGSFGVFTRRDAAGLLTALVIMFAAPAIALVGFAEVGSGAPAPPLGTVLALLAVVSVLAIVVVATTVLSLVWRQRHTSDLDELADLEG